MGKDSKDVGAVVTVAGRRRVLKAGATMAGALA